VVTHGYLKLRPAGGQASILPTPAGLFAKIAVFRFAPGAAMRRLTRDCVIYEAPLRDVAESSACMTTPRRRAPIRRHRSPLLA
jgi:hypothetical protein